MITFKEWLEKQEMAGGDAVYDGTKNKDFNWWGAPETAGRKPSEIGKPAKQKKGCKKK